MLNLNKSKLKFVGVLAIQTIILSGITLFAVFPFSCKITQEGIEIIGGDYTPPSIVDFSVIDGKTVKMNFSDAVKLNEVIVSNNTDKIKADVEYIDDKNSVLFKFEKETKIGNRYELFGVVEDKIGNTLTFCIPFTGYNSKLPKIVMTEVQIKKGTGKENGVEVFRSEFVELLALENGNLAGLELHSASDGVAKKYVFSPVEVKKGEIVVVHLRKAGDGCINETVNLDEATAPFSKNGVRDLWSDNTGARFNDTFDVIYLRNSVSDKIVDALMYAQPSVSEWKSNVSEVVEEVVKSGIYSDGSIDNVVSSKGCSALKSLTRTDARDIYNDLTNGGVISYPCKCNSNTWEIKPVSPGIL